MAQPKLIRKFGHHYISKMTPMVYDNSLGETETRNNMIEYEHSCNFSISCECRHHLGPFGKVIYNENNIRMPPSQVRVTCNEINAPFRKRTNKNDWLKRSWRRTHLSIKNLAVVASSDHNNTILEQ